MARPPRKRLLPLVLRADICRWSADDCIEWLVEHVGARYDPVNVRHVYGITLSVEQLRAHVVMHSELSHEEASRLPRQPRDVAEGAA